MSEPSEGQTPNPGSPEAIAIGCSCPVLDNGHGKGYMGVPGTFVYNESCAVHVKDLDAIWERMVQP